MAREASLIVRHCLQDVLGDKNVVKGIIVAMQDHGELLHFHPLCLQNSVGSILLDLQEIHG